MNTTCCELSEYRLPILSSPPIPPLLFLSSNFLAVRETFVHGRHSKINLKAIVVATREPFFIMVWCQERGVRIFPDSLTSIWSTYVKYACVILEIGSYVPERWSPGHRNETTRTRASLLLTIKSEDLSKIWLFVELAPSGRFVKRKSGINIPDVFWSSPQVP